MTIKRKINSISLELIRKILLKKRYYGIDQFANYSFSQMGEDRILDVIFLHKKNGFYVDIGAYHPKLYSNTYSFYLKGWRGINIDPNKKNIKLFNRIRPEDVNLRVAVGTNESIEKYYNFSNPAVNTLSKNFAKSILSRGEYKLLKTSIVKTIPLSVILEKHLQKNKKIDFMNIDTEGSDFDVLISNNWNKFSPSVILVEDTNFSFEQINKSRIYRFLKNKGYKLKAKTNETLIFIK